MADLTGVLLVPSTQQLAADPAFIMGVFLALAIVLVAIAANHWRVIPLAQAGTALCVWIASTALYVRVLPPGRESLLLATSAALSIAILMCMLMYTIDLGDQRSEKVLVWTQEALRSRVSSHYLTYEEMPATVQFAVRETGFVTFPATYASFVLPFVGLMGVFAGPVPEGYAFATISALAAAALLVIQVRAARVRYAGVIADCEGPPVCHVVHGLWPRFVQCPEPQDAEFAYYDGRYVWLGYRGIGGGCGVVIAGLAKSVPEGVLAIDRRRWRRLRLLRLWPV